MSARTKNMRLVSSCIH